MSVNKEDTLRQFCDVTGADDARSRFFLESSNWQLEVNVPILFHVSLYLFSICNYFINILTGILFTISYSNRRHLYC